MIVVDSSFLIAFHNPSDAHHPAASVLMERFLAGEWGTGLLLEYVPGTDRAGDAVSGGGGAGGAVTRGPELAGRCRLAVDGTGVGGVVVDLMRRARPGCVLMPVNITSGQM